MAGDWIPMRVDLAEDPAVILVSTRLNIGEATVVGLLHRLWSWANRQLDDGYARGVTVEWIDRYLSAPGFAAALIEAGWLQTRSGAVHFTNFDRWNSQGAKTRALTARRMKRSRDAIRDGDSVTRASPEKRREEKKKETPSESPAAEPAKVKKPREPNPLFDAVAEITGADPKASGRFIGVVQAALAKAEPPYTPDEVREFGRRFRELCPWSEGRRPTPGEVEKYIGLLRSGQGVPQPRPQHRGFETPAQRMMNNLVDAMEEDDRE